MSLSLRMNTSEVGEATTIRDFWRSNSRTFKKTELSPRKKNRLKASQARNRQPSDSLTHRQTSKHSWHHRLISITSHSNRWCLILQLLLRRNSGHPSSQAKAHSVRVKYSFNRSKIIQRIRFKRAQLSSQQRFSNHSLGRFMARLRHRQHSSRSDNNRRLLLSLNSNQYLGRLLRLKLNKPFLDP